MTNKLDYARVCVCVCVVYVRILLTTALVASCKLQIFTLIKQKPVKIFPAAKAPSHQVKVACVRIQHIGSWQFPWQKETVETIKKSFQPSGHRLDHWHSFYRKILLFDSCVICRCEKQKHFSAVHAARAKRTTIGTSVTAYSSVCVTIFIHIHGVTRWCAIRCESGINEVKINNFID